MTRHDQITPDQIWEIILIKGGVHIDFNTKNEALRMTFTLNASRKLHNNPDMMMYAVRRPIELDDGKWRVKVVLKEELLPTYLGIKDPETDEQITLADAYRQLEEEQ